MRGKTDSALNLLTSRHRRYFMYSRWNLILRLQDFIKRCFSRVSSNKSPESRRHLHHRESSQRCCSKLSFKVASNSSRMCLVDKKGFFFCVFLFAAKHVHNACQTLWFTLIKSSWPISPLKCAVPPSPQSKPHFYLNTSVNTICCLPRERESTSPPKL